MSDYIVIDVCNVIFGAICRSPYGGTVSVRKLINRGSVTITEAIDAFVEELLNASYAVDEANLSIRLVIDGHNRANTYIVRKGHRSIAINVVADADSFILDIFSPENVRFRHNRGDNIYVVTSDKGLKENIHRSVRLVSRHKRPNVKVYRVPSQRTQNPIIPIFIDILSVKDRGRAQHLRNY